MVAAAALAGWSWRVAMRGGGPFRRREAALLVAWATCSAVARLVGMLPGSRAQVAANLLLVLSSSLALVAVAGVVRRISAAIGGLGAAVAEAALNATSLVTLAWVLAGGPLSPPPSALLSAAPALIDVGISALILRLATLVPGAVSQAGN